MMAREALYRLIDEFPDDALPAVERYRAAMAAPVDDEDSSPEELVIGLWIDGSAPTEGETVALTIRDQARARV